MKVTVKTLKGNQFDLEVEGTSSVAEVKRQIEEKQGKDFPADSQLLIYKGKVLSDDKTLAEHSVSENGFLVVMTTKSKQPAAGASSSAPAADTLAPPPPAAVPAAAPPVVTATPAAAAPSVEPGTAASVPPPAPGPAAAAAAAAPGDLYGQTASNLVAGQALESTVARIMDMGGGMWDRDTVVRALHAAYNNPDRAIDYLYSGIPETAEPAPPVARPPAPAAAAAPAAPAAQAPAQPAAPSGPNAAPLDLFPQGMPGIGGGAGAGALDFLRNNPQFQALRGMVQANPQILQPMLQELGKQNPQLLGLINNNQAEFLRLINEPGAEGGEGDLFGGMQAPQPTAINVTPEEREAIGRLEALGFDRALVIEAFFACDKNEQLAANYLLEHAGEFDD